MRNAEFVRQRVEGLRAGLELEPDKTATVEGIVAHLVDLAGDPAGVDLSLLSPVALLLYRIAQEHGIRPIVAGTAIHAAGCPTCSDATVQRAPWTAGECDACRSRPTPDRENRALRYLVERGQSTRSSMLRALRMTAGELDADLAEPIRVGAVVEVRNATDGRSVTAYRLADQG